jgi:hypothetical protein
MPAPQKAVDQQDIWKDAQMRHFACALIEHALARLNAGNLTFTTDCVPDSERIVNGVHIGNGVPGSVLTKLQNANIVRPKGICDVTGKFYQDRMKSMREDAKTRYVNVYELCSRAVAEEFLRRNKIKAASPQLEMAIETPRRFYFD